MIPKKPPDKHRVLQIPLKRIIKNNSSISKLFDAVTRVNKLVIHAYQFLRLWILQKYHNNEIIPVINTDVIKMAFKVLATDSVGPKPKGTNKTYYNEFMQFYENEYRDLGYKEKIDGTNLSQIIGYTTISVLTAIENNIKLNFFNYIRKFVNSSFSKEHKLILKNYSSKEKIKMNKHLKKELYGVKQDLINNTKLSDIKYHAWIDKHRTNILPIDIDKCCQIDVNNNPQKYLKHMIYMNIQLEELECKMFQFFPLRTNIIPKYIPLDSKSIVELLFDKNLNEYLGNITKYQKEIWETHFKLDHSIFTLKNYTFDYYIMTDGVTVSIYFLHDNFTEKNKLTKEVKTNGRKQYKEETRNLSQDEKDKLKQDKLDDRKKQLKEIADKRKAEYAKLSKEEKKELRDKNKSKKYIEFPYLDELNDIQLNDLETNAVYCDPGKRDLFKMLNDNGKLFTYSNKQHVHKTKRLKYQRLLKNYKDKIHITEIENKLSNFNSKSCSIFTFKEYISNKNVINQALFIKYYQPKFRQYRWYLFINKERAESQLLDTIEKEFGIKDPDTGKLKKLNIVMGDWSIGKQMRNFISTPNITLKRKLTERFNVYNIDEYNTSKLHHKEEVKCKHLYYTDKTNKLRKLHSVLTLKMENSRRECINRDVNAVNNMKKLVKYYIGHKSRPINYTRITAVNPQVLSQPVPNDSMPAKVRLHSDETEIKKVLMQIPNQNLQINSSGKLLNIKSVPKQNKRKLTEKVLIKELSVNSSNNKIKLKKSKIEITT